MQKKQLIGPLVCLLTAFIWGVTFVMQDIAAAHVPPFTFQCVRSMIAAMVLIPVAWLRQKYFKVTPAVSTAPPAPPRRSLLLGGVICGAILAAASVFQQFGITNDTSPGKTAFITALYLVFVPAFGILYGKRAPLRIYLCAAVALGGLWLLCVGGGERLGKGDLQVIVCSLIFALHIIAVDCFAPYVDGIWLSTVQFVTSAVISGVLMLIFEAPTVAGVLSVAGPLLFVGVVSTAGAYTLQIIGQQLTPTVAASLLFSLESVFAVLASLVIQKNAPSGRELVGMGIIFVAIAVAQIPMESIRKKSKNA